MTEWMAALVAGLGTGLVVLALVPLARRVDLMDKPCERKLHGVETPMVGGLAIVIGLTLALPFLAASLPPSLLYLGLGAVAIVLLGVADDRHHLNAGTRLGLQALIATMVILASGFSLESLGSLFVAGSPVYTGLVAIPFTVFAVVGIINAYNMIDGLDGLCGSLTLMSLAFLALAASLAGAQWLPILIVLGAAVLGFLVHNLRFPGQPRARVFLGDSGSMLLGFLIAFLAVGMSQGEARVFAPVMALWLVAIPLFDTLSLILHRLLSGRSPMSADRGHLHHLLQDGGLSVGQTLLAILGLQALAAGLGLALWRLGAPEPLQFSTFLAALVVYGVLVTLHRRRHGVMRASQPVTDSSHD